ncbi:MAG: hypothetical protein ACOC8I_03670 [Desulfosalsimonas sp.]
MLEEIRKPVFVLAVVLMGIIVIFEAGSSAVLGMQSSEAARAVAESGAAAPGIGIPYMAVFDLLVLFSVLLICASLIVPERLHGRTQGIVTLIVSLLILLVSIGLLFTAISRLFLMLGLLLSPIFGTIAYFSIYGWFDTAAARVVLGFVMSLKFGFAILLVLSHQRFVENKGLVLILLSSLGAGVIVGICYGIVPGSLVSITDAAAAVIVMVMAVIWSLFFLGGSVKSIVKAAV